MEQLDSRIRRLQKLINSQSVGKIETAFKNEEVNHLEKHLKKYPEVRYSEKILKKMFKEAKSKKLSAGRKKYLTELKELSINFKNSAYLKETMSDTKDFVNVLSGLGNKIEDIKIIRIEHGDSLDHFYCHIYGDDKKYKYDNELNFFSLNYDFLEIMNFQNHKKYIELCEILSFVDIEGEEYMIAFEELNKCRSYKLVEMAVNRKLIRDKIINDLGLRDAVIEIGEHDNRFFEIFKC